VRIGPLKKKRHDSKMPQRGKSSTQNKTGPREPAPPEERLPSRNLSKGQSGREKASVGEDEKKIIGSA